MKRKTDAEYQKISRKRRKDRGLIRRDVWARQEDWPEIRKLEKKSQESIEKDD